MQINRAQWHTQAEMTETIIKFALFLSPTRQQPPTPPTRSAKKPSHADKPTCFCIQNKAYSIAAPFPPVKYLNPNDIIDLVMRKCKQ